VFSIQIFLENTFLETKPNFLLTENCFSLINFYNDKQTHKNLKNNFSKIIFQKTNMRFPTLFYYLLIGVDYFKYIVHNFCELWSYPYQIEILKLHVSMKEGQPNKFLIKFSLPFSLHAKNKCYYLHQGGSWYHFKFF
jgi:hypothetical protein